MRGGATSGTSVGDLSNKEARGDPARRRRMTATCRADIIAPLMREDAHEAQ